MSADFIARIVGLFVFAFIGGYVGYWLGNLGEVNVALYTVVLTLVGALFGLVVTPYFTTRPARGHAVTDGACLARNAILGTCWAWYRA